MEQGDEFARIVGAVVTRFMAQHGARAPVAPVLRRLAGQLRAVIDERGLPRPLAAEERGAPGGLPDAECAALVARVMAGLASEPLLAEAARQLVKACFHREFRVCRDSFREVGADGSCRRQQLERVRARISGSHCVDCPHWVALEPGAHASMLAAEWCGDSAEFLQERAVFLPEDFRELRRWLHAAARR